MEDLRWILLLAGLVFLAGLAAWELRRPRQGRRDALGPPERNEPQLGQLHELAIGSATPHAPAPSYSEIPPLGSPLVISLDDPIRPPTIHPVPVPSYEPAEVVPPESYLQVQEPVEAAESAETADVTAATETGGQAQVEAEAEAEVPTGGLEPGEIVVPLLPAAEPIAPIVEWPPEQQRHILSVRVVGLSAERLAGRSLRQALGACGFVHGRFGIFHQPGADGRALLSAANLNKPGMFDPATMDFQRFRGLGLFTVLPGPLPPAAALDHLLDTASDLAERLHARLQDEHGQPLDEVRLEALARTVQDISNGALRAEPAA
jgi:FtsZ-interacting cell division protein ZipA